MLMSLSIAVTFVSGSSAEESDDDHGAERQPEAVDQIGEAGAHFFVVSAFRRTSAALIERSLELTTGEVLFLEADVVVDRRRRQLRAGVVALVGHHQIEHRPDPFDALEPARLEVLHPLVAPVEDVRGCDDELAP